MKKLLLSAMVMAALVLSASAEDYMSVHTKDGQTINYNVDDVTLVDYFDDALPSDTVVTGLYKALTVSGKIGNYTYTDLGFQSGIKWATYNVGASTPTDYGDYFAWGETSPKNTYADENYKFVSNHYFTKYNSCKDDGVVDSLFRLQAEDDAATANWGGSWRMPTKTEITELIEGCKWEWTSNFNGSGVAGRIGTSYINGNTIFLPAAGFRDTALCSVGILGRYWASSLYSTQIFVGDNCEDCYYISTSDGTLAYYYTYWAAWELPFNSDEKYGISVPLSWSRVDGLSVRAVSK